MLKNNICITKIRKEMENNRIRDVQVDHYMMKKETICHISVIWDIEVMKLFTQSVRHIGNIVL